MKHDPSFRGPIQNRSTNIQTESKFHNLYISLFFFFSNPAWSQGDPRKVIYPTDSRGQFCGQAGTPLEKKPFLFYFNIMKCASPMVLLEFQCPTTQVEYTSVEFCDTASFQLHYSLLVCVNRPLQIKCDEKFLKQINTRGSLHRNATVVMEARQVVMKIFEDFTHCWYWILLGLVIAMIISLVFLILLRFLAGIMVWVMIAMLVAVIGYGIFHCYMEYAALKGEAGANVTIKDLGFQTDFTVYLQIRQTWLAFIIILAIVEVIIILLLIFLWKRILIAIALIKEASRAIGHMLCSLFYPLFTFLLLAVVIAYWGVTAVFLSTSNQPIYKIFNETNCDYSRQTCDPAVSFSPLYLCTPYHKYLIALQFYNVFLFFWCANFVLGLGQMTLAGAFASYYWAAKKPDDIPAFPVFSSLGRSLRYHTGTLAFGSLILSIIQIIRVLLEYLDHKLKGAQNKFAKFLLCCLKCCFWCLEKFVKFLNRNAYIMSAIYGKNFCTSARDAFFLLMRNVIRVAVLDKVTDFILFLGKLLIVGLLGVFSFFFFSGRVKAFQNTAPTLNYYWVPILTMVVCSYLIAHAFFSVYSMCVDTLFLCFCEDLERNDGSAARPYYMSPSLREILWKNKEEDPSEPSAQQQQQQHDEDTQLKQEAQEEDTA
uniref:Choline transporter-like protein n=1 Tax=Astatotilapia calliptera TaxID=8154 RepID=A0AAX7TLR4_ASTCA